jgi:hypothetical protein
VEVASGSLGSSSFCSGWGWSVWFCISRLVSAALAIHLCEQGVLHEDVWRVVSGLLEQFGRIRSHPKAQG